jgi:primosomal protein N' (replication factor Y)
VLLGTATPSIETYQNALNGKFGLVTLSERFRGVQLPEIVFADLRREKKFDTMKSHFSSILMEEMTEKLNNGEQIILFQNRRGYTPYWTCEVCSSSPKCINCDVHLTYHKHSNTLKCHYCGYGTPPIGTCGTCGSNRIVMMGFGTEKIEDELRILFPNHVTKRLDLDTTRSKNAYEEILDDFDIQRIHILVGTQMITKGLDFDNVGLVGVLDADNLLKRPDFRANERSFQLFSQVAGRAGRKGKRGKVVIQTVEPENWVLDLIQKHDYLSFFNHELIERKNYFYPPFFKLIHLTLKHKEENKLVPASIELAGLLKDVFKERVMGPEKPTIARINNYFLRQIYIKYEKEVSDKIVKENVTSILNKFYEKPVNKTVKVVMDVDPI